MKHKYALFFLFPPATAAAIRHFTKDEFFNKSQVTLRPLLKPFNKNEIPNY